MLVCCTFIMLILLTVKDLVLELPPEIENATTQHMKNLQTRDTSPVPSKVCVQVLAFFNKGFKKERGGKKKAKSTIRRLFKGVNKIFKYPGLDVEVHFELKRGNLSA